MLPNALTPIISFAPFAIVGSDRRRWSRSISSASACRRRPPRWGELIGQGKDEHPRVAPRSSSPLLRDVPYAPAGDRLHRGGGPRGIRSRRSSAGSGSTVNDPQVAAVESTPDARTGDRTPLLSVKRLASTYFHVGGGDRQGGRLASPSTCPPGRGPGHRRASPARGSRVTQSLSIMRLVPDPPGQDRLGRSGPLRWPETCSQLSYRRGPLRCGASDIAMIFQEPMTSAEPRLHGRHAGDRGGDRTHEKLARRGRVRQSARSTMLTQVGIPACRRAPNATTTRTSSRAACASA